MELPKPSRVPLGVVPAQPWDEVLCPLHLTPINRGVAYRLRVGAQHFGPCSNWTSATSSLSLAGGRSDDVDAVGLKSICDGLDLASLLRSGFGGQAEPLSRRALVDPQVVQ